MGSRRQVLAALAVAATALALGAGSTSAAKKDRIRTGFLFKVTALGFEQGLSGKVILEERASQGREKIEVTVDSQALDPGVELDVYAVNPTNQKDPVFAGTLTLAPRPGRGNRTRGVLELKNYDGGVLPPELSPVLDVARVFVTPHGEAETLLLDTQQGNGGGGDGKNEIELTPTELGVQKQVTGRAETETSGARQRFKVEAESRKLKAGNFLVVRFSVAGGGQSLVAGSFPLTQAGPGRVKGEIEFDSQEATLPPGAAPVSNITGVTVSRIGDDAVLLTGVF
jgi:hypothetical protein